VNVQFTYYPDPVPSEPEKLPEYINRQLLNITSELQEVFSDISSTISALRNKVTMYGITGLSFVNGAIINPYTSVVPFNTDEVDISYNQTTGIFTVNKDGWYEVFGHFEGNGSIAGSNVAVRIVAGGVAYYLGVIPVVATFPVGANAFNGWIKVYLLATNTVFADVSISGGGGGNYTVTAAILEVRESV